MLKMYQDHAHSGDSAELWEGNWEAARFNEVLKFSQVDPLLPLFEKYARPGMTMLEGGCGLGQYVIFNKFRGLKVVGLDFAQRALKRLDDRVPGLMLTGGDVSVLPFADETFDLYYSGGVVEHFEDGAEKSLSEAHRVLKKDGVLLLSVPYHSPLRSALMPLRRQFWKKVSGSKEERTHNGSSFFQYAYKIGEFEKMLSDAGLKVIKAQGYAVLWGIYELPFFSQKGEINVAGFQSEQTEEVQIPDFSQPIRSSLIKRLVVSEDDTVPVLGLGVKFMRWAAANMMMYVCVRKESVYK